LSHNLIELTLKAFTAKDAKDAKERQIEPQRRCPFASVAVKAVLDW
jgi:hypothetical protein